MKITIKSTNIETKEGTSSKTGKPYTLYLQTAEAETVEFRAKLELTLGDDAKAYPVGEYSVDWDRSVVVDQYGSFRFARQLVLIPARAAAPVAVAAK